MQMNYSSKMVEKIVKVVYEQEVNDVNGKVTTQNCPE